MEADKLCKNLAILPLDKFEEYIQKVELKKLERLKEYLDDVYYNSGETEMPDERYDIIKDMVVKRDPKYRPVVGAALREGENRIELPFWLGSADKITPSESEELKKWLKENDNPSSVVISDKLDGVSCLLVRNGPKLKLYTRGDGFIGADISYLAGYFKLPKIKKDIAVRGELIIRKDIFAKKYKDKAVNSRLYKNPRNMVAGLINSKTAREGLEDIDFVTYEIVQDNAPAPEEQFNELEKIGFKVAKHEVIPLGKTTKLTIPFLSETLLQYNADSPYKIDGIIIQANESYDRNTSGNPSYMFAFKAPALGAAKNTTIKSIEWSISKWGQLKPVAIIEPIHTEEITMSRVTAHNAKYVEENKLGPGAIIEVIRSKDVIPYISDVIKGAKNPQMPDMPFVWDKNHVNIVTTQDESSTMCVKLLSGFFDKLGIKHVSEATVKKMIDDGLDNLIKIVSADEKRLLQVPEFQQRSAERIYTNIHNGLQNIKVTTLLGASGVLGYGISTKKLDTLFLALPNLLTDYKGKSKSELIELINSVEGFSTISSEKIADNLKYADLLLKKLKPYISIKKVERKGNNLTEKKIVMSGFRDKGLEEEIAQRGGKVTTSVSGKTSMVVVAKKGGKLTGKIAKASSLGIPIYDKEEFLKKYIK